MAKAARSLRRRRASRPSPGAIRGTARIDRRTKNLATRIKSGEIAVIMHEDIDQLAAEALVEADVAAVVNLHRSMTGRYPNGGPLALARAEIPLIDGVGEQLLEHLAEGDTIVIEGEAIRSDDGIEIGRGVVLGGERLAVALAEAEGGIGEELDRFVRNTIEFMRDERDLVLRGDGMPAISTPIDGRDVVVVVRGSEFRRDLKTLRGYIKETRPVLIAVDGAADALLDEGHTPDIVIGDMDSVTDEALVCGAEIVVHAYPDGSAPGLERVRDLGLDAQTFASAGTSEDIALLLAFEKGADLIVAVGAHDNLVEYLDKQRGGMASTFVVRLKVGPKLVDAKGVNRLWRSTVRTRDMVILVGSAVIAMLVAGASSPSLRLLIRNAIDAAQDLMRSVF